MNTTNHAQLTGRLNAEGCPARNAKQLVSERIADKARLKSKRREAPRQPGSETLASFDASLADDPEIEELEKRLGLGC